VVYGYLAVKSNNDGAMDLLEFLGSYWLAAAVILVYWFYLGEKNVSTSLRMIFFWAIVFRLVGIFGSPVLEDDFYRYLLDGCVFVSSGTPYGIAPSSLFSGNTLTPECQAALNWVNNPDLPTIYGPLLQYVFALSHILSPANIDFLQVMLVVFDLGVILILARMASPRAVMLYAWSPLVLKEIAFTAHPDVVGALLLLGAFSYRYQGRSVYACILVALACSAKIFALLALPFFLFRQPLKHWLIVAGVMIVLYLPFLFQGHTDMIVLGIFAERWEFNASVFEVVRLAVSDMAARLLCLGLFLAWYGYYFVQYYQQRFAPEIPRMDWIFGMFFIMSPVVNAWYLLWLLPYATLRPSYWAWTASVVISLSYATGLNLVESNLGAYQIDPYARALEIAAISVALLFDYRAGRLRISPATPG
jgi:hypothetical protein